MLALFEAAAFLDAGLNLVDILFVQPARLVFAIAGDEGNRVTAVEQLDGAFDLGKRKPDVPCDLSQVSIHRWDHWEVLQRTGHPGKARKQLAQKSLLAEQSSPA